MDNINPVTAWLLAHNASLSARRALDFRPLAPGVYTHRTLALSASRDGITDGVHTLLVVAAADGGTRVVEVQHANLEVRLDTPPTPFRGARKECRDKTSSPVRTSSRVAALVNDLSDLL